MFDRVLKTCLWYSVLIVFPVNQWRGPRSESFYSRNQQKLSSKQEPNLFHYSFWCSRRIVEDIFISLGEVSWYGNSLSGIELPILEAYVRILLIVSLSLNQIVALCKANLDDSIDSGNFSVRGYLPLIRRDSSTHMHGLAVFVKEGLPSARDLSLENSADSCLSFRLALLHWVECITPFSSINHLFHLYAQFLIRFHLT